MEDSIGKYSGTHLNWDQQRRIKIQHTDIISPPHWPQVIPSGYHNQKITNQLGDYSIAARNIYDVLSPLDVGFENHP
jgi:hypothetical protein